MKDDPGIGHCKFADGAMRPIYDDGRRQYVIDNDNILSVVDMTAGTVKKFKVGRSLQIEAL